ncbi:MAG: bifunctional methylenetetrahydrofolate dehydrogenase/methenyltetrahydrofolate cyclohydrolase FolD [Armatimonadetes bacterium]|nr:bifunctional methylenetetrahydrofolate dehydrogenase/methenyltetrahydrofolate cyclohydrolase FolD [Armatimonadota bacterium]
MLLDGKRIAGEVRNRLKPRVEALRSKGIAPCLAAIVIGDDPASHAYVGMKAKACASVQMESKVVALPSEIDQRQAEQRLLELARDPSVHGILLQHPAPKHLDEMRLLSLIPVEKDVDGISPGSLGALTAGIKGFEPCTPKGMIRLLDEYKIAIEGKRAVVIGRSVILGKPMALMLLNRNATVTICHSKTVDLPQVAREADILVAAVGRAEMIDANYVKPGAAVLDAGYNRLPDRSGDVGDVRFDAVAPIASYITPVPGGVGPMTVAMLLENTVEAAENASA